MSTSFNTDNDHLKTYRHGYDRRRSSLLRKKKDQTTQKELVNAHKHNQDNANLQARTAKMASEL